jgi:hypothetical protein
MNLNNSSTCLRYHHCLKRLRNTGFNVVFCVKMCKKCVFLTFFEAKYAFFEAFLGVKNGVFWHFGCFKVRKSV